MSKKLLNSDIEPACEYCARGKTTAGKESVLCLKKGVMMPWSHCRKFKYDPLKREPKKAPRLGEFTKEDFTL